MKTLTALKSELLGIVCNRKLLIAIIGVMTIPLLYSGTFLWAFWNPYGQVDRMPVAVVNNDQGASFDGKKLEIGDDLVKSLKQGKSLNWQFVSQAKADRGLINQEYYIKIEIPKDFSKNATTLQSGHPEKLNLIYTPNEGYNYLSSKIGDSAIEKIKEEVSSAVTKTYAETMLNSLKDAGAGLNKAGNGAAELNSGINHAYDSTKQLKAGIDSANSGAKDINSGAVSVNDGAKQMEENLKSLAEKSIDFSNGVDSASSGSKQLQTGLEQFGAGISQMKSGNAELLAGADKTQAGAVQLSTGLHTAASQLPELQGGTKKLANGSTQLSTLLDQWSKGAQNTKSGADEVSLGLQKAVTLVSQMEAGTNDPLEKAKLAALKGNLAQLSAGSQQVAGGVNQLTENAAGLKQASDQLAAGAGQLNQKQSQLAGGLNQLAAGADQVAGGQEQLTTGLAAFGSKIDLAMKGYNQLTNGSSSLTSGLDQLASSSVKLKDGTGQLAAGSKQLADGTGKLTNGINNLAAGTSRLASGSNNLASGINKLSSGSAELKNQLVDGAKAAGGVKANNQVYNMVAKPVTLKEQSINTVPDYGTGFTPYFLSLSLFVGALVISIIFPMLTPASKPKSGFSWFISKLGILLAVGLVQAMLADVVLLKGLGLEVKSIPYFFMLSIFTSWTFMAIIQFLVTVLDNPGRFIGIIILIAQLTSSAGTYPIELVPKLFQNLNHFLPMTYTIAGFRAIISTGQFGYMWENIGVISVFFILFLAGTLTFFVNKYNRQIRPELE